MKVGSKKKMGISRTDIPHIKNNFYFTKSTEKGLIGKCLGSFYKHGKNVIKEIELNSVGVLVMEIIDGETNVGLIEKRLCTLFPSVEPNIIEADLDAFLIRLIEIDAVIMNYSKISFPETVVRNYFI